MSQLTWAAVFLGKTVFAVSLSIGAFRLAVLLNRRFSTPLLNPLLLAIAFIIIVLSVFNIPLSTYETGGQVISLLLAPATTVLAYSIYRQIDILKKNLIPIIMGCFVGSLTSMGSAFILCKLFGLDETLTASVIPKSVTTPIAMQISEELGGIVSVTVAVVIITGILGAMLAPTLIKAFRVKNPVAAGIAIGTCSHAVGTSRAVEIGELEGAMSGVAIGISGLITVILAIVLQMFL